MKVYHLERQKKEKDDQGYACLCRENMWLKETLVMHLMFSLSSLWNYAMVLLERKFKIIKLNILRMIRLLTILLFWFLIYSVDYLPLSFVLNSSISVQFSPFFSRVVSLNLYRSKSYYQINNYVFMLLVDRKM